jgi:hypothetical protein
MKDHAVLGYLLLRDNLRLGVLPPHVAYQHHEWQDGSGYPRGLTGTNRVVHGVEIHVPGRITPMAEIAAIADFHDACSADRPHRRRFPPDQVWRMVRDAAGRQLNREMVDRFLMALPPFPVATQVLITGGRWQGYTGVVARVKRDMHHPVVRVLANELRERIEPFELDLTLDDATICGIVRQPADGLDPTSVPAAIRP